MRYLFVVMIVLPVHVFAQFKNDNVLYKTIYWEDFCRQYKSQKDALILDVRSRAEYDDTARSASLNIGHLAGAKHINVTELGEHIHELDAYKNKPVYIYCSHSQRSRRSSKMLADSGFTNVFNINGGLTDLYFKEAASIPCKNELLVSSTGYAKLNPKQIHDLIQDNPHMQIIDVRKDSAFKGLPGNAKEKALGQMKNAINVPLSQLEHSFSKIDKSKPVLLVDAGGDDAGKAASFLVSKGYTNVSIVFDGLDALLAATVAEKQWTDPLINRNILYQTLDAASFDAMASQDIVIVDVRPEDEFNNKAAQSWRNRGHIKNAINMPLEKLATDYGSLPKNKPVVVYSMSNSPESYEAAETLVQKGFDKVYVLTPGIWGMRYQAFNSPHSAQLTKWVVDIPEENL